MARSGMSAISALRQQIMSGITANDYEPQGKLSILMQEMITLICGATDNPIITAIMAAAKPVIRKLDETPADQQLQFLDAISRIVQAATNVEVDLDAFRAILAEEAPNLKTAIAKAPH